MEIIPVIDIKERTVVRAIEGHRDRYRPITTPLSRSSDPIDVARGLLSVYPFTSLYVADLDAIEGRGNNTGALDRLKAAFRNLTLWVDDGISDLDRATHWLAGGRGVLVLGSETQTDGALARRFAGDPRVVLSLDFRGDGFQGPRELLDDPTCWPARVIVMTLARVGSGAGPDLDRLSAVRALASGRRLYAAGGVRDAGDLAALRDAGIAGALVATCLHDGQVTGSDIAGL